LKVLMVALHDKWCLFKNVVRKNARPDPGYLVLMSKWLFAIMQKCIS